MPQKPVRPRGQILDDEHNFSRNIQDATLQTARNHMSDI